MIGEAPGGGRAEVRIDRSDVGRRVSVRRVSEVVQGRPVFRDVVGVLASWDGQVVTVIPRDREPVSFPEQLMIAAKTVPLFPGRRAALPEADPTALQRLATRSWPAVEREQLGEWTLRAAAGFTSRANSCQALGDPGLPLPEALAAVERWYAARGLPGVIEITTPGSPAIDGLGAPFTPALVQTAPLAPLVRAGGGYERVRLARTAGPDWMSRYHRVGGGPAAEAAARQVLHGGPSVWFATAPDPAGGAPLAIGRCVVDGPWAHFSALETAPEARRTGLATALTAVLASRAAEEGATGAYLQVEADNAGAVALYDRLGFTTSHTYHYARLPQR
ncbi:GNAT family N-acetyltransferase [Kitasatospora sp. McL0602]|uniref:GNAT family N-acetyltransferase n=1 Tax=Kitasatospora sp. McL0602 TaxID=3439530 RepID=UPI003F8B0612